MLPKIPRLRAPSLAVLALAAFAIPCEAQFRDARLPRQGRFWMQVAPELLNWTEQFALNSSVDSIADGDREPIANHFGGPLTARMFPAPEALAEALNADADALGFDPVTLDDVSFGDLDFSVMRAQVRRLALGGEIGVLDWISVGFRAPFTLADMTTRFAFDSTTATVTGLAPDLRPGRTFSSDTRDALGALVTVHVAGRAQRRFVATGSSYLSQSALSPLVFGLGGALAADSVVVRWPGTRAVTRTGPVAAGSVVTVMQTPDSNAVRNRGLARRPTSERPMG